MRLETFSVYGLGESDDIEPTQIKSPSFTHLISTTQNVLGLERGEGFPFNEKGTVHDIIGHRIYHINQKLQTETMAFTWRELDRVNSFWSCSPNAAARMPRVCGPLPALICVRSNALQGPTGLALFGLSDTWYADRSVYANHYPLEDLMLFGYFFHRHIHCNSY